MTLRADRRPLNVRATRAAQFGLVLAAGLGAHAASASAQSYLADDGNGSVTVDYSVLGQGGTAPGSSPMNLAAGGLPGGTCSCAGAPLGVIAAAPQPTFNSPFSNMQSMAAPAVPPGFMTYASAVGGATSSSSGERIVLRPPSETGQNAMPQMAEMLAAEPATTNLPMTTPTANAASPAPEATPPAVAAAPAAETPLPATTATQQPQATQTVSAAAAASSASTFNETPPSQPDTMPASIPSPVQPSDTANAPVTSPATTGPAAAALPATTPTQQPAATPPATTATATPPATTATATGNSAASTNTTATTDNSAATDNSTQTSTAPAAQPTTEQQAAVTPPAPASASATPPASPGTLPTGGTRILYKDADESDDVPADATAGLDAVAKQMLGDENMRVQILAYAAGTEDTESKARRKSLARGLAVRSYLIKAGVRSTRIDVRALGTKADGGPADRVDIIPGDLIRRDADLQLNSQLQA